MKVYLDNAATSKLDPRVLKKMMPYLTDKFENPSSIHLAGQQLFLEMEAARNKIAKIINGEPGGIIFTSSATEAANLILRGVARANKDKGRNKIIVSSIEHPCVLETAKELESEGFVVDYLEANKKGIIEPAELKKKIDKSTLIVSVMMVNNEIGTINKVRELAKISHQQGALFHSDAVQAVPYLKLNVIKDEIDFLSLSAHKFNGPKGVGLAYIKPGIKIREIISGGEQEESRRAGTHNLPGIIAMAYALELAYKERDKYLKTVRELRDYLWQSLQKEIKGLSVNGCLKSRVPANLNVMFGSIEGEAILMDLSSKGIAVSTGSACSASNLHSSYVLKAIGLREYELNSNIRFSLGRFNNKKEIDYTVKAVKETVTRLRKFSPIKN